MHTVIRLKGVVQVTPSDACVSTERTVKIRKVLGPDLEVYTELKYFDQMGQTLLSHGLEGPSQFSVTVKHMGAFHTQSESQMVPL